MIDFSSSLYLGMNHDSAALQPWSKFTSGIPAVLGSPPGADEAASRLAALQGCQRGLLGRSTLDLFWDLLGLLAEGRNDIFFDAQTYPIARWAAERAAARGASVQTIGHHDVNMLKKLARNSARRGMRPVMIADGFCPGCGKAAPLVEYLDALRKFGGLMILDDTQALGIFGSSPTSDAPYGVGGGGTLRSSNIAGPDVLVVSSLAKGFGAPVAVIVGSEAMVRCFEARSETRVHCSPPSIPAIRAAEHALEINREQGDLLRSRLARLVQNFRRQTMNAGIHLFGGCFPMQSLETVDAASVFERLVRLGINPVLRHPRSSSMPRISFIVTCKHRQIDIDRAVAAMVCAMKQVGAGRTRFSVIGPDHATADSNPRCDCAHDTLDHS